MKSWFLALLTGFLLALPACAGGPEPIRYGTDTCDLCRMVISDKRFAAEFIDTGNRVYKFDGVDELARFLAQQPQEGQAYVVDGPSGELIPAGEAAYLVSPDIRGPMGGPVMSFADATAAEAHAEAENLSDPRVVGYEEALRAVTEADARARR